jgi:hypothetical protein
MWDRRALRLFYVYFVLFCLCPIYVCFFSTPPNKRWPMYSFCQKEFMEASVVLSCMPSRVNNQKREWELAKTERRGRVVTVLSPGVALACITRHLLLLPCLPSYYPPVFFYCPSPISGGGQTMLLMTNYLSPSPLTFLSLSLSLSVLTTLTRQYSNKVI